MSTSTGELPQPIRKKDFARVRHKIGFPFPNYGLGETELPALCRCYYDGQEFFVTNEADMLMLYENGAFGTSSTTFRAPSGFTESDYHQKYYFKRRMLSRNERSLQSPDIERNRQAQEKEKLETPTPMDTLESDSATNGLEPEVPVCLKANGNGECHSESEEAIIVDRVEGDNSKNDTIDPSHSEESEDERLILLPEEVIYLSFAVGCVSIQHSKTRDQLSFQQVWNTLVQEKPEFPYFYAVYHYFRSKNWVPKEGSKFGGDYVLYMIGPDFYHSTYIIHINGLPSRSPYKWIELLGWQRCASNVWKFSLICNVEAPNGFQSINSTPRCIFTMKLKEVILSRYIHPTCG